MAVEDVRAGRGDRVAVVGSSLAAARGSTINLKHKGELWLSVLPCCLKIKVNVKVAGFRPGSRHTFD
jgi:hypothetical protein